MPRSRSWAFTDFSLDEALWVNLDCVYLVFGREKSPTTDRKHLQGYVYFETLKSHTQMQKIKELHWTACIGSAEQNRTYCIKDGDYFEKGVMPEQGKRTDIEAAVSMVANGATDRELIEAHPAQFVRYFRGLHAVRASLVAPRSAPPNVRWYFGPTGAGKTRAAFEEAGEGVYFKPMDTPFWEGYTGQPCVILDDIRPSAFSFDQLLRVLDRYPLIVNIKGSSSQFNSPDIWITAPLPPRDLFINHHTGLVFEHIGQLERRISCLREFKQ